MLPRVHKYDETGRLLWVVTPIETGSLSIRADNEGNVFVLGCSVEKFSRDGHFVRQWEGTRSDKGGWLVSPNGKVTKVGDLIDE